MMKYVDKNFLGFFNIWVFEAQGNVPFEAARAPVVPPISL